MTLSFLHQIHPEPLLVRCGVAAENLRARHARTISNKEIITKIMPVGRFLYSDITTMRTWHLCKKLAGNVEELVSWFECFDTNLIPENERDAEAEARTAIEGSIRRQNLWGMANVANVAFPFSDLCSFANKNYISDGALYAVCRTACWSPGSLNFVFFVVDPTFVEITNMADRI